ncbi:MAG: hypothetical protein MZV64_10335 [Ignavibacteriales bacterium]|nr:hypothetical protein [Ignavibacteriales bacterium]
MARAVHARGPRDPVSGCRSCRNLPGRYDGIPKQGVKCALQVCVVIVACEVTQSVQQLAAQRHQYGCLVVRLGSVRAGCKLVAGT